MDENSCGNCTPRRRNTEGTSVGRRIWGWIKSILYIPASILAAVLLGGVILIFGFIPTESMEPNHAAGSVFIGNRLVAKDSLKCGDTVLFRYTQNTIYIKRVIGVPGDTIAFADGCVIVNGKTLDESAYLEASIMTYPHDTDEFVVPEGSYFVLGDNRAASFDSRFWDDPFVDFDDVVASSVHSLYIPFLSDYLKGIYSS